MDIPTQISGALWLSIGTLVVSFGITIYQLYLNYQQAEVKKQMAELIQNTIDTNQILSRIERKLK